MNSPQRRGDAEKKRVLDCVVAFRFSVNNSKKSLLKFCVSAVNTKRQVIKNGNAN